MLATLCKVKYTRLHLFKLFPVNWDVTIILTGFRVPQMSQIM